MAACMNLYGVLCEVKYSWSSYRGKGPYAQSICKYKDEREQ